MARYTGPKRRLSRREGVALFAKDAAFIERKGAVAPGPHGTSRRPRKQSEYGVQLREKQKTKRIFGLMERQFRKYYEMASKSKGNTGLSLMENLEMRLDNVVYRLGFSTSRAGARQMVSHGHIRVDGKRVDIPSFMVKVGQTIAIGPKMLDNTQIAKSLKDGDVPVSWLDRKAAVGKVVRVPSRDEMEQGVNESLIVEFYSR
jgi:small subunit ribosomal protein S4